MQHAPSVERATESVVIGLQALHLLNQHGVAITATSLEVWMLHASGALPLLSEDVTRCIAKKEAVSEAEVSELFERHCAKPAWDAAPGLQAGTSADLSDACASIESMTRVTDDFFRTVEWAMGTLGSADDTAKLRTVAQVLLNVSAKASHDSEKARLSLSALRRRIELRREGQT